jgi:glycosyltransferase involved in cell wall biosynthesis
VLLYGLSMVRNEASVVHVNVLYHLSLGFDRLLIVDNGSTDGTDRVLRRLSKDPRVRWARDAGGFQQGKVFTRLAREAFHEGADWVAPVDADDFWYAPKGNFREILEETPAAALRVGMIDFIQRREQRKAARDELRYMTWRVPEPVPRDGRHEELLESRRISYIELARVPKIINRASRQANLVKGAHQISGIDGPTVDTDEIVILHAPLRSFAGLEAKAASVGRRGIEGSTTAGPGWHARRWHELRKSGDLEREWEANSQADGYLDVYGSRHSLILDTTLRDAVSPFMERPLWSRLSDRG